MTTIQFKIESCKECPFFEERRLYTSDSFENVFDWFCTKYEVKKIAGYVEWRDKPRIPDWCPIKVKEDENTD